jgi:hypothetical protein
VRHWEVLGQAYTLDGTVLKLTRRDNEYIILADGTSLMSSRMHGSEEALATFACGRVRKLEKRMRRSLGGYSLQNSERLWSFRKWAGSITGMNATRPNLAGFALSEE